MKNLPAMQKTQVRSLDQEWLPTPVLLPGEFYGQENLVGYIEIPLKDSAKHPVLVKPRVDDILEPCPRELAHQPGFPNLSGTLQNQRFSS